MNTILVVDDEPGIRTTLKDILEDEGYRVETAEDGIVALAAIEAERPELVVLDVWLPRMGGIDVLSEIKKRYPELEVVVISGHANIDLAVRAVKLGAFDFIEKPLSIDRVLTATRNAFGMARLRQENRALRRRAMPAEEAVARSAAMREVLKVADQAAKSNARVLVTGENGTGKEMLARRIHALSDRAEGPFVAVNCAAIPDTLIESELFGHERGAFTDAVSRRIGRFEAADGGTLFLDEIADMSASAQAKVLRAIQEMRFERVGGEAPIEVDVRVIAATNKDLAEEIAGGRFREDLFFRLNVVPVRMPSLRERPEDVPELCARFLDDIAASRGDSRGTRSFSPEALALVSGCRWPGNVRELRNFVERVSVMTEEHVISAETARAFLPGQAKDAPKRDRGPVPEAYATLKLADARERFERDYIGQKLQEFGYNITRTAEAIGVYPSNLHAKMKKLGIEVGK